MCYTNLTFTVFKSVTVCQVNRKYFFLSETGKTALSNCETCVPLNNFNNLLQPIVLNSKPGYALYRSFNTHFTKYRHTDFSTIPFRSTFCLESKEKSNKTDYAQNQILESKLNVFIP